MANAENKINLSAIETATAGACSGLITRALIQPFDVLKIRFQLQVEPISKTDVSKYNSMIQATRLIYHEEGIKAFWKGHNPAQILSISFGLIQFWCFETMVMKLKKNNMYHRKTLMNFLCGATAGCVSTFLTFPFDIMRTRLVAQSEYNKVYHGMYCGYKHLIRHEGIFSLYKGISPTLVAVAPSVGGQFMFYNLFDSIYRSIIIIKDNEYNVIGTMISGSLAGLVSKTITYPLDLTRKRMQIQGFQKYRLQFGSPFICKSMLECLLKTYQIEGTKGLFKGMGPSVIKALSASALSFSTYEYVSQFIRNLYNL